jgi:hypothetical protein
VERLLSSRQQFAHVHQADVASSVTFISSVVTILVATALFAESVRADPAVNQGSNRNQKVEERAVFITGSLIPQRVKVLPIGTTTVSPVRVIDRRQIDWTGRPTTPGALINEPSVHIIGH